MTLANPSLTLLSAEGIIFLPLHQDTCKISSMITSHKYKTFILKIHPPFQSKGADRPLSFCVLFPEYSSDRLSYFVPSLGTEVEACDPTVYLASILKRDLKMTT